jgi:capsular polysaccharide biosynthesis protein
VTTTQKPPQQQIRKRSGGDRRLPTRVGVQAAIRRYWPLVVGPAVLFSLFAIVIGMIRTPTYTAETQLNVGDTALPNTSVGQAVQGNQLLASIYARLINAQEVTQGAATSLGVDPADVAGHLAASPIPESSVIRVEASASDAQRAVDLANAGGDALTEHVAAINSDTTRSEQLLGQFQEAVKRETDAKALLDQRQASFDANPSSANEEALTNAGAAFEAAKLERESLEDVFRASQEGLSSDRGMQTVSAATSASSDRSSVLQRLVFIGLIGGIGVGIALATLRANSATRRRV